MKKFKFFLIYLILLNSCGGGLKNEKIRTTDEFLVEKRKPLVLPPNYEEVLKPNSKIQKNNNQQEEIKKILKAPKDKNVKGNSSSTEESILNKIKK